jgi:hypothetical protein
MMTFIEFKEHAGNGINLPQSTRSKVIRRFW